MQVGGERNLRVHPSVQTSRVCQNPKPDNLLAEMMESETPPPASPSNRADDHEVSSRRVSPNQQVVQGMTKTLHEGDTSARTPVFEPQGPAGTRNPTEVL